MDQLGDLIVNIDIQGGEVGLMSPEIMSLFFKTIGPVHKISVSTNGEFLKRGYHKLAEIRQHLGVIMWHVADLKNSPDLVEDYHDEEMPISRGIVHDDINEILEFVRKNNHILFDYIEFEFDILEPRKMCKDDYLKLIDGLDKFDNVTDNAMEILRRRLIEKESHRDNCRRLNHSIMIDLVNETIPLCQRQPKVSIPLNKDILKHRLLTFPKDIWFESNCNSCTRLYAGKFYGNVIERALRTRYVINKNV
jgi:hypothetical protein